MEKKSKMSALLQSDYEKKKKELMDDEKFLAKEQKPKEAKSKETKKEEAKDNVQESEKVSKDEKLKKAVQKRIDELVAKGKQKDALIVTLENKIAELSAGNVAAEENSAEAEYKKAMTALRDIRKKQLNAKDDQLDELIAKELEILEKLRAIKVTIADGEKRKDAEKESKVLGERSAKWAEGIKRAVEAFPDIFHQDESKFNSDNPLYKKAISVLTEEGAEPVHNIALAKNGFKINPRFDHGDGFYAAVLEAANLLNLADAGNEIKLAKKENERLKAKQQLLSGGLYPQSVSPKAKEEAKLSELRDKMLSEGADSAAGIEYYRHIRNRSK